MAWEYSDINVDVRLGDPFNIGGDALEGGILTIDPPEYQTCIFHVSERNAGITHASHGLTGGGPPPMITPGAYSLSRKLTKEEEKMTPIDYIANWITKSDEIIDKKISDRILIVEAFTGSGKSTAMPALLYEKIIKLTGNKSIVVTQPKILMAQQLAKEQGEAPWFPFLTYEQNVGYITSSAKVVPSDNMALIYVTVGILLQHFALHRDEMIMAKYKIIQVDEVHERSREIDELLMYIKLFLIKNHNNPECPIFLMSSATFNTKFYANYFGVETSNIITVQGITFPITKHFLSTNAPNWVDAMANCIEQIHTKEDKRDILAFVHGAQEIDLIKAKVSRFNNASKPFLLITLSGDDVRQETLNLKLAYMEPNDLKMTEELTFSPNGNLLAHRRIILSTNVAESGVNLRNLGYVVDNGLTKGTELLQPYNIGGLLTKAISKASAKQRMGRVGRFFPGDAYLMYTEATYATMQDQPHPAIITDNISTFVLNLIDVNTIEDENGKITSTFNIESIDLLDTPPTWSLLQSIEYNFMYGYITDNPVLSLTFMGKIARRCIYMSPAQLRCVFAAIMFNVSVQDMVTLMAVMSTQPYRFGKNINTDIFKMVLPAPYDYNKYKYMSLCDMIDFLCIFNAFCKDMKDPFKFCKENGMRMDNMINFIENRMVFIEELYRLGIDVRYNEKYMLSHTPEHDFLNRIRDIKRCLYEGFKFNLLKYDPNSQRYKTRHGLEVFIRGYPCLSKELVAEYTASHMNRAPNKPTYVLALSPELSCHFSSTYKYSIEASRLSVMDGFVPIDDTLFEARTE